MNLARALWTRYESIHAVVYFHPAALGTLEDGGLRGFWRGYFAQRAAPLGRVGEAPVRAAFFGFSRAMTQRAVPAVWDIVSPDQALELRRQAASNALRELGVTEDVADELYELSSRLPVEGRVLAAANLVLLAPGDPLERLWQAATTLREHRGDGHNAALVAAGLTGLETLVLRGAHDLDGKRLQEVRGWTDDEWAAARARLAERDLLGTDAGRSLLAEVEATTDRIAWDGWVAAGGTEEDARRLARALQGPAEVCRASIPEVNPIGLPLLEPV